MLKVILVGIGGMGGCHFDSYKGIEGAEVIAVADVQTDMARKKVNNENIKIYADINDALDNEQADIVDICTPSYMHTDMVIKALEKGFNVISEKPMALSFKDAEKIEKAVKSSGRNFMVAHVLRFMGTYKYLKSVVDSNELGKLLRLDMKRISSMPKWSWENWMADIRKSGHVLVDLSIHDIDFMQYMFGYPADIQAIYYPMKNDSNYIVCNFAYDGFCVTTEAAWYDAPVGFSMTYFAVFEKGTVKLTEDGSVYKNEELVDLGENSDAEDTKINIKRFDSYPAELEYFVNCVKNGIKPDIVTPESSAESIRLAEDIMKKAIFI